MLIVKNQADDTQSGRGFSLQRAPVLTSPREAGLDRFYEGAESLFVRAYDAFYAGGAPPIAGDIAFYDRLAQATGGPVLELGCGTGRIALALAQAGLSLTGVDVSAGMLALARRKSERLAAAATRIRAGLSPFAPMPGPEVPDDQLIDGETAWRRRYAAQHGGWINGPNAQLSYAPGSVEFERSKNRP